MYTITITKAYACLRIEVPDGTYTLIRDDAEDVAVEANYAAQQDLGQSPEEPKAVPEEDEGKHRLHLSYFFKIIYF